MGSFNTKLTIFSRHLSHHQLLFQGMLCCHSISISLAREGRDSNHTNPGGGQVIASPASGCYPNQSVHNILPIASHQWLLSQSIHSYKFTKLLPPVASILINPTKSIRLSSPATNLINHFTICSQLTIGEIV